MTSEREELYRRLDQVRRHVGSVLDAVTKERLSALAVDLEAQIAMVEFKDSDAPPE